MSAARCWIGTSGWSYSHWAGGRFYPKGLASRDWLRYYAGHFPTVEVNASFYRLPTEAMVARWAEVAPRGFTFAVKLWRRITHEKRLADCREPLEAYFRRVAPLRSHRGPLLVQLPPSFRRDDERLVAFLDELRSVLGRQRWRIAIEFRSRDWICPEVYELLTRRRVAVVLADWPRCEVRTPNDAPFVYIRRHGPGGRYRGCYSDEHLARDAEEIRGWLREGREVFAYFNNDVEGHAVDNARRLMALVGPPCRPALRATRRR